MDLVYEKTFRLLSRTSLEYSLMSCPGQEILHKKLIIFQIQKISNFYQRPVDSTNRI